MGGFNNGSIKIDNASTEGLTGVEDSIAYRITEIEKHFHNTEKWFGKAVTPSGEDHVADRMASSNSAFILTSGSDAVGSWVQILGPDDTPVKTGMVKFDARRMMVQSTSSTKPFIIQVVAGEFSDIADKISAEEYTETPYISGTNNNDSGIEDIMVRRTIVGEKIWARIRCIGAVGATMNLFYGIHEYEG